LSAVDTDSLAGLEVVRVGRGAPLLLLHGPTPVAVELPFIQRLSRYAEIIASSHPGFGRSPRPDDFDSMYDLVHLYLDLIEQLPYAKVVLAGFSFGGWLAAEIATACSHKIRSLILVDPVGLKLGPRDQRDITHLFNTPPAELEARAWHDATRRPSGPFGLGWQMHVQELADEDLVLLARAWDALCLYAWRPHLFNPHLQRWLCRISVPTLVLWGASDRIVSVDYGRTYSQLIPGAKFEVIADAGHHPELEQPEAFVERVVAFLDESES
jgi:pimeloyl-ACP methyl ester carboxylesterase